jgi:hypothetical protein
MDASYGWILENKGNATFKVMYPKESGFWAGGDVRNMIRIENIGRPVWIMGRHNGWAQGYLIGRGY